MIINVMSIGSTCASTDESFYAKYCLVRCPEKDFPSIVLVLNVMGGLGVGWVATICVGLCKY